MPASWSYDFDPLLSLPLALSVTGLIVALALAGVALRRPGRWMRLAAALFLSLAVFNPVLLRELRDPVKSVVAIIVDRSQSQDIGNRQAQTDAAVADLKKKLARYPQFEVREVEAGRSGKAEDHVETRLFSALDSAFSDVEPARIGGAVMVTDGEVHDAPEHLSTFHAPLHALITGSENEKDRRIAFINAPRFGIVGKQLKMTYKIFDSSGDAGLHDVRVRVNGEQVAIERAQAGVDQPLEIDIPNAGRNIVEIAIDAGEDEITATNNRAIALVDGIRENLRVLLVSGEPHSGERTWRNLLKSDASVDLVHFTILRPPEKQDGTPINELSLIAFPTRELFVEKINDFDLIILDRYQHRDVLPILYYDYIAQYVKNGGALLIAAGPEFAGVNSIARTPLMPALPGLPTGEVTEKGFYPRLTDIGKRHPVTRGLEGSETEPPRWSRWFRLIGIDNPEGEVVMSGPDQRPLLVLNRYGEGRVGMLLSDQGWLWARGFEGGGPYVALYRRLAHWLMKEPELEEERLTAEGKGMTLNITRQTMQDDPGPVTVLPPSGKAVTVNLAKTEPGLFKATYDASEIGLYQIASGDFLTLAHVGPVNAPEFAATISTPDILKPLAQESGGSVRRIASATGGIRVPSVVPVSGNAAASGRDWIGFRQTDASILKSVDRIPLFSGFLGLGLIFAAFAAMWYREGR